MALSPHQLFDFIQATQDERVIKALVANGKVNVATNLVIAIDDYVFYFKNHENVIVEIHSDHDKTP